MKILILSVAVYFFSSVFAVAEQPKNMVLSYDLENYTLFVRLEHICHDRDTEFIDKLEISINGQMPIIEHYGLQKNDKIFFASLVLTAHADDVIKVKAYAKEGGELEGEIVVKKTGTKE